MITEDFKMQWGKHVGKPLKEIPGEYLIMIYHKNYCEPELREYIVANLHRLQQLNN